ncbi:serine protease [Desulfocucumis palustris]|uniref:Serine protease n=1 Tax=Desulfocucumis palustris TaxID=1898651 RepID=A0A2L2X900_9FIRM|nr:trypsin-like peptidase domain-containing protein [Desulfocucumis palustris]GBF32500.1 serine protease [Desulfocucumis palustris]
MCELFKDVAAGRWSAADIERVSRAGLITGYADGTFKPEKAVTREEMASVISRLLFRDGLFNDILPRVRQATVMLFSSKGMGTGFYISSAGHLVTNKHVAAEPLMTVINDGETANRNAKVIAASETPDLALLKVDGYTPKEFLKFSRQNPVQGDHVGIMGAPGGLADTFTQGQISSTEREDYFQTDASVNPGNSGGPAFNEKGEVVGIVVSKLPGYEGIGFIIPYNKIAAFLKNNGVPVL